MPIGGARTPLGLLFQGIAGGISGLIFTLLTMRQKRKAIT